VLGSNVVNIAFNLGLALALSGVPSPCDSVQRDFRIALAVPIFMAILFLDSKLSRFDGFLMLGMFVAWRIAVVVEDKNNARPWTNLRCSMVAV
jgi:cation:H+ antiporter